MPEFIADKAGTVNGLEWDDLSPFLQGYIECMLFTETSNIPMTEWHTEESQEAIREGQSDGNIPQDAGFSDIHPDTLAKMHLDCAAFQDAARHLLSQAYGKPERTRNGPVPYDANRAGMDFWYSRNGHGTGFWDRDLGDIGDQLAALCGWEARDTTGLGEVNVWFSETPEEDSPTGYGYIHI